MEFLCSKELLILHWGVGSRAKEWTCTDDVVKNLPNTKKFNEKAAQTSFIGERINMKLSKKHKFINFVFFDPTCVNLSLFRINGITTTPCLNNGTCLTQGTSNFTCQCQPLYTGTFCEYGKLRQNLFLKIIIIFRHLVA